MPTLTIPQRVVLNYLVAAPRTDPASRDFTIWWFNTTSYIPEFKADSGLLFSKPPAGLTPQTIDALAAAGMLTVSKRADLWAIQITPAGNSESSTPQGEPTNLSRLTIGDGAEQMTTGPAPEPKPSNPGPTPDDTQQTRVRLAQLIDDTFDREELQNLCFDLGVDYDNLVGERKETRARHLVGRMQKDGRLPELRLVLSQMRPTRYAQLFGR